MNSVGGEWIGMSEGSGVDRVTEGRGGYLMITCTVLAPKH